MRRILFRCRFALLYLLPVAAVAQERAMLFDHLSIEDGLSNSWVWSVHQDSQGFMWFGTADGLNRYDGYSFLIYENDPADPDSLSHNEVLAICEDPGGDLWIGTRGGGLDRFDKAEERFVHFRYDPDDPGSLSDDIVWGLVVSRAGELWIATRQGLDRYQRDSGRFVRYLHDPADPNTLSNDLVSSLFEDRSGYLWLGTKDGLDRFDPATETFVHHRHDPDDPASLSVSRVNEIHGDAEGYLWVGTEAGLDRWDPKTQTFRHFRHDGADPGSVSDDAILDVLVDKAGDVWVTTRNGGLNRWNPSTGIFSHYRHDPTDHRSLSHDFINIVYEDRTGILWMGSYDGVNKYDPRREQFTAYRRREGSDRSLASSSVLGLLEDRRGDLWIATPDAGLQRIDRKRGTLVHYLSDPADPRSLPYNDIHKVYEDGEGRIWVGTGGGGLAALDPESGEFVRYRHDPDDPRSAISDFVTDILEDRSGRMWVGTPEGLALFDRDRGSFERFANADGGQGDLDRTWFRVIFEDRSGTLWFGTNSRGLYHLEPGAESLASLRNDPADANSLSSDSIGSLFESSSGYLWVGTIGGGLTGLDPERRRFVRFLASDGLPSNLVRGIVEDEAGHLWISTSRGLAKFDPPSGTFERFDVDDGLACDEFYRGAALSTKGGELIFGGDGGLTAFRPEEIVRDGRAPPIVLTDFRVMNERVSLRRIDPTSPLEKSILVTEEIVLSHRQNAFSLEFSALHYSSPRRNRYAYRLEGFDRDWIQTDSDKRFARYTNLDPGTYVFRVKGSNHHGAWNERGVALRIVVRPPLWRSGWALSLYGALSLALVSAAFGRNRRKVAQERETSDLQRRELASLVERKTAQLEEAMADLKMKNAELEGFAYTVSHDLRSPLMTILGFIGLLRRDVATGRLERLEDNARRIEEGAQKMSQLLSELLELSRIGRMVNTPKRLAFDSLVREALDLVAGQISERGVEVEVAADLPEVVADRVRLVEMLQNLLANAVKFMGSQEKPRIEVGARNQGRDPVFYVRDNGMGIDARYHAKIFGLFERLDPQVEGTGIGLALAKRIVEVHGGRIWVESAGEGRGSTFCFTLPRGAEADPPASPDRRDGP